MTATTSPVLSVNRITAPTSAAGERFRAARRQTMQLCAPLTPEDMMVQSCAEASPAKWHLAHTTWFFESFVLREFLPGYRVFHADFAWLFNSYYESFSAFPEKRLRASFSRPGLDEILRYREHVDAAMERLFEQEPEAEALRRIELGANHEEQHLELLLTDMLHAFFTNPLKPKYREQGNKGTRERENREQESREQGSEGTREPLTQLGFAEFEGGLREVGHAGGGFCFDNEMPRHRVWLEPYALANRLVTCGEFAEFMADGGYQKPEFWLSAGWDAVKQNGWRAPLYWSEDEGERNVFTLRGELPLKELAATPVSQVSFYEADAYARWAGRGCLRSLSGRLRWRARRWRETCWTPESLCRCLPRISSKTRRCEALRGLLGVDEQRLPGLSGISSAGRNAGRVQRQIHERADGAARRIVRHAGTAHPRQLPQFFCAGDTLAVFRNPAGEVMEQLPIAAKKQSHRNSGSCI